MCCCRSKIAKCLITTFAVGVILGGLTIIGLGFWLILNAGTVLGDTDNSIGEIAKRVTIVSAIVGGVAICFGILAILVTRTQKTWGICLFGFVSAVMTTVMAAAAYALL